MCVIHSVMTFLIRKNVGIIISIIIIIIIIRISNNKNINYMFNDLFAGISDLKK